MGEDLLGIRMNYKEGTREEQMEEFMFLGLRRCEGVELDAFYQRFGERIERIYKDTLADLEKKKLIEQVGERIRLTEYGIDVSNMVLSEFLLS